MTQVNAEVQRELVRVLQNIERMEIPERRGSLYSFGFEEAERRKLNAERVGDLDADLRGIVRQTAIFEKLDILISNAMSLAVNYPYILNQLQTLLDQVEEIERREPPKSTPKVEVLESISRIYGTGNRWAVLVGVNKYKDKNNYGRLHVCVKDVHALQEHLVTGGYDPGRIRLLTDDANELPTKDNILVALKAVADGTEKDDLLLFYYSGHGDEDEGESYLVTRKGMRLLLADTAVPISRIKEIMEGASARAKVIIIDACHSGADIGSKGAQPMSAEFIRRVFEEAEGLAILASCKQGQISYEWRAQERSVFTHFLLEAFMGKADRDRKGFVTVQDTSRHVTDNVKLWASQQNLSQTPTLEYRVSGDIILVSSK